MTAEAMTPQRSERVSLKQKAASFLADGKERLGKHMSALQEKLPLQKAKEQVGTLVHTSREKLSAYTSSLKEVWRGTEENKETSTILENNKPQEQNPQASGENENRKAESETSSQTAEEKYTHLSTPAITELLQLAKQALGEYATDSQGQNNWRHAKEARATSLLLAETSKKYGLSPTEVFQLYQLDRSMRYPGTFSTPQQYLSEPEVSALKNRLGEYRAEQTTFKENQDNSHNLTQEEQKQMLNNYQEFLATIARTLGTKKEQLQSSSSNIDEWLKTQPELYYTMNQENVELPTNNLYSLDKLQKIAAIRAGRDLVVNKSNKEIIKQWIASRENSYLSITEKSQLDAVKKVLEEGTESPQGYQQLALVLSGITPQAA